jgi:N-acetylmuramoyl-L-alanine amidase
MKSFAGSRMVKFTSPLLAAVVFVSSAAAAGQAPSGSYLTTTEVKVRRGPGVNYEVVATIPKDVQVNVVGREGHWLKVESKHGNKPGYIDEQYARPLPAQQTAQNKADGAMVGASYRTIRDTDLREGPGLKYRIAAKLPADIKINVLRAEGDWLRVESKRGNKPGYVEKRDVERWTDR